jgi:hypothetical protein
MLVENKRDTNAQQPLTSHSSTEDSISAFSAIATIANEYAAIWGVL